METSCDLSTTGKRFQKRVVRWNKLKQLRKPIGPVVIDTK